LGLRDRQQRRIAPQARRPRGNRFQCDVAPDPLDVVARAQLFSRGGAVWDSRIEPRAGCGFDAGQVTHFAGQY